MKAKFIFKGFLECEHCHLVFAVSNGFHLQTCTAEVGQSVTLKGMCPACDNEIKATFKVEKITRELSKTYTMRC
ncbi:hypothetical protein [Campylobacter estrildidarum]|uniref:Uncharacterized protein n=1 Tax=Campylobacter estrildidarum TaxID=2510189 RepID=A0A4U7BJN6_9BACT|nr:hypothetical protein [Campylobacter estrildidarum]TKX28177.1 hypothetical protein CQA69_08550 [Campylobacter estrildidarum]